MIFGGNLCSRMARGVAIELEFCLRALGTLAQIPQMHKTQYKNAGPKSVQAHEAIEDQLKIVAVDMLKFEQGPNAPFARRRFQASRRTFLNFCFSGPGAPALSQLCFVKFGLLPAPWSANSALGPCVDDGQQDSAWHVRRANRHGLDYSRNTVVCSRYEPSCFARRRPPPRT